MVIRPAPKGYSPGKTIVMINHTSGSDPWVSCATLFPWELKYVVKGELLAIPIAGWCLSLAGDLAVRFTKDKGTGVDFCRLSVNPILYTLKSVLRN